MILCVIEHVPVADVGTTSAQVMTLWPTATQVVPCAAMTAGAYTAGVWSRGLTATTSPPAATTLVVGRRVIQTIVGSSLIVCLVSIVSGYSYNIYCRSV